jgi:uncharacterized caspase-like protein
VRKALVIGIDQYNHLTRLTGAVRDACSVASVLEYHADEQKNFEVRLLTGASDADGIDRHALKEAIRELFKGNGEVALLYFAGHGHLETTGGYLCGMDCKTGDDGVPLAEIMMLANTSQFDSRVILLDSCHSGIAGGGTLLKPLLQKSRMASLSLRHPLRSNTLVKRTVPAFSRVFF